MKAQSETRGRLWQHGFENRSPAALAAAMSLWTIHVVGNNTKTAVMTALVLFKVRTAGSMPLSEVMNILLL